MAKSVTKISIRAYATHLGISDKTIRKAIQSGKLKKGVSYVTKMQAGKEVEVPEINLEIADKEWGYLHKTDKVKPGQNKVDKIQKASAEKVIKKPEISPQFDGADLSESADLSPEDEQLVSSMVITNNLTYGEATRRREIIGLVMDKYKLQELEGSMIKKDVVDKALFGFGVELKKALLNIPARITSDVRSAGNDVEAQTIITMEITNILEQFSNLETLIIN